MPSGRYPYRHALITGASSGIGAEFAAQLARLGASLTLVARRADRLKNLAQGLGRQYGVPVEVLALDLGSEADLDTVARSAGDRERPVELLVNCAGYTATGLFGTSPLERDTHQIRVNVVAPVVLSHAVLEGMRERGHGGILHVSSITSVLPMPKTTLYGAAKAFLSAFGESLHMETRADGVHVTTVRTGLTRTEFHKVAGVDTSGLPPLGWLEPERVVASALRAVAKGRPFVTPGAFYRPQPFLLGALPRSVVRSMVRRTYRI
ncbi:SDR family NAD(P)-dependent oxidoreductase [Streptomyces luteireticuli]|uniref:SDR family NAD(P)-dependent oxidoreductase n=1 Tax=Streptomyces luteireticuli TaxID=173858 RepID=UPI0035561E86